MKIETFEQILKGCNKSLRMANVYNLVVGRERGDDKNIVIRVKPEQKKCRTCGTDLTKNLSSKLYVSFNKPQKRLTVFEASMLWMVLKQKLVAYDYASYHKCIAGQRLIENIKTWE